MRLFVKNSLEKLIKASMECCASPERNFQNSPTEKHDDTISQPESHEVGEIRMIRHYKIHLNAKGDFPSDSKNFRCNSITRDNWDNFFMCPDSHMILEVTRDGPSNSPHALGASGNLAIPHTP